MKLTEPAYTKTERLRAVKLVALLGWAMVALPIAATNFNPLLWLASAVIGLPIAFVLCWLFGTPVLKRIMRNEVSWLSAAVWGAILGAMIYSFYIGIDLYLGWQQIQDPNFHSRIGSGDYTTAIDGILTPYGWRMLALEFIVFALKGAVVGISVRWAIGPGSPTE